MKLVGFLVALLIWITVFTYGTGKVFAETIPSFNSEILVHQNGDLDVKETIIYDFESEYKHGIFRYIPISAKVGDLYRQIEVIPKTVLRDKNAETFTKYEQGESIYIKIGDPQKTITGLHTYEIDYLVKNSQGNFDDHDEIYWNVTGNGWEVPIYKVNAVVLADFSVDIQKAKCFTGTLGSNSQDCDYKIAGNLVSLITKNVLQPSEGLTVVAGFPANTFPKATLQKYAPGELTPTQKAIVYGLIALGFLAFYIFIPLWLLLWFQKNKKKNRFGKVSVNFDIPKDDKGNIIPPAEVGAVDNGKLEKDDLIGTIFDWAIRKYIKIEEIKKSNFLIFERGIDYKFIKLKDPKELRSYETTLFNNFFEDNKEFSLSSLGRDFYITFETMKTELFSSLISRKYYTKDPAFQKGAFLMFAIFAFCTLNIFLGIMMIVFYIKMNGRTQEGDLMDWKVDGLKLFLKNMSREYKWQAKNLYTVEKYIPYAISLGYIDEFMDQLKIIYPNYNPSWYVGSGNFYSFTPALNHSMSTTFATNAPSSGSGFGGGGSSGGGGGGGGGGSW